MIPNARIKHHSSSMAPGNLHSKKLKTDRNFVCKLTKLRRITTVQRDVWNQNTSPHMSLVLIGFVRIGKSSFEIPPFKPIHPFRLFCQQPKKCVLSRANIFTTKLGQKEVTLRTSLFWGHFGNSFKRGYYVCVCVCMYIYIYIYTYI